MAKGNNQQTITSRQHLTPDQRALIKATKPLVKNYVKTVGDTGVQLPSKPLVKSFTPEQKRGQQMALDAASRQNQLAKSGLQTSRDLLAMDPLSGKDAVVEQWKDPNAGATDFLLNKVLFPETNPALQQAIAAATRPITDQLLEEALPAVRSGAYTTGNFGSSRQGIAEGLATGRAARAVGDTAAGVANQGYQAGLDAMSRAYGDQLAASTSAYGTRQGALSNLYSNNMNARLNALGLLPQTQASQLAPALTTSGVGDVRQAQAQAERNEDIYRRLFSQMSPLQSAEQLIALSGALPGGSATTTSPLPQANPISGALGGASLGAALTPVLGPFAPLGGAALGGALSF